MRTSTADILKELSDLGPRPPGSEAGDTASWLIRDQLEQLGLNVRSHEFAFEGWEVGRRPRLMIDGLGEILCTAMLGSGGGYFSGYLEYHGTCIVWGMYEWETYRVREEGRVSAYILVRPDGPAIAQPVPDGAADVPHLAVGTESAGHLLRAAAAGSRVEGELDSRFEDARLSNLRSWTGSDAMSGGDRLVFLTAHSDTVPGSPGAYDNAGGVAALLGVAEMLADGGLPERVQLLFTDGEEFHLAGSRAFVEELARMGRLDQVAGCVNLDGTGRGEILDVWLGPESLAEDLHPVLGDGRARFTFPPPPSGDHYAFWERGIPSVMLTFNDPEILHRPTDTFDPRKAENAETMAHLARKVVTKLTEEAIW